MAFFRVNWCQNKVRELPRSSKAPRKVLIKRLCYKTHLTLIINIKIINIESYIFSVLNSVTLDKHTMRIFCEILFGFSKQKTENRSVLFIEEAKNNPKMILNMKSITSGTWKNICRKKIKNVESGRKSLFLFRV